MAIQDYAAAAKATAGAAPAAQTPGLKPLPAPTPDTKIAQLAAAAQGGSAGLTAYKQAQTELDQLQANALANARKRASLIGGPEAQGFEAIAAQDYDRARRNLSTQEQSFQGHQAANRGAFDKYFGQLKGDMGSINQWIKSQLGSYDSNLAARAAAKQAKAATTDKLTKARLLGAGQTLADDYSQLTNTPNAFTAEETARALAAYKGIDPTTVNELLGPREAPKPAPKQVPPGPDASWLLDRDISEAKTQEVLQAPEAQLANQFVGQLVNARISNGRLDDDGLLAGWKGLTPQEAFTRWINEQPGTLTMKAAMRDYYLPWISQNLT